MTRNEKRILRVALQQVVHHDKNAWWALKREIWDRGYQSYYDAQDDFMDAAERALEILPDEVRSSLCVEWNKANPQRGEISETNFVSAYTMLILDEVIKRAWVAAYRTIHW